MNLSSNPWSFVPADIVSATPAASPGGVVPVGAGAPFLAALTTTAPHGFAPGNFLTYINSTDARYNGFYKFLSGSGSTGFIQSISSPGSGLSSNLNSFGAGTGGGTIALCAYPWMIRAEDMSWIKDITPADTIDVRDRNGNIVWTAQATASAPLTRGKPMWIDGITLVQMSGGVLIVTIN